MAYQAYFVFLFMHNSTAKQLISFNYTTNAEENNAVKVLVINNDSEIVAAYLNQ